MDNQSPKPPVDDKDIDLGVLFAVFAKVFRSGLSALRSFFRLLLDGLVLVLLFLKKWILLLVTALVLSLVPGLFNYLTKGSEYVSAMTVKANFESAHDLYNKVEYFNSLIRLGDTKKLSALFHLNETEAGKLIRFEVDPVIDELQVAELYKKVFYNQLEYVERNSDVKIVKDTAWGNLIRYQDFKKKLTDYDYPMQEVRLYSFLPEVYDNVGAGLIDAVTMNKGLTAIKQMRDSSDREQAQLIINTLSETDTLMKAFNKKIASGEKTETPALSLSTQPSRSAEIDLFEKKAELRNSLSGLRQRSEDHRNILEVYSGFNSTGASTRPLVQSFFRYSLWCLAAMIVILLLVEAYSAIDQVEKRRQNA
jgi:hypothetical protein